MGIAPIPGFPGALSNRQSLHNRISESHYTGPVNKKRRFVSVFISPDFDTIKTPSSGASPVTKAPVLYNGLYLTDRHSTMVIYPWVSFLFFRAL